MNPSVIRSVGALSLDAKPDRVSFYKKSEPLETPGELVRVPELLELVANTWKPKANLDNDVAVECVEIECPITLPYPLPTMMFTVHSEHGIIRDEEIIVHRVFHHCHSFPAYASVGYVVKDNIHSCMVCGDDWKHDLEGAFAKGLKPSSPVKHRQSVKRRGMLRASSASIDKPWVHCRGCGNLVCASKCIAPTMVLIEELSTLPVQYVCKLCHWGQKVISARPSAVHGVVLNTQAARISLCLSSAEACEKLSGNVLVLTTNRLPGEVQRGRAVSTTPRVERLGSSDSRRHWNRMEEASARDDDELAQLAPPIGSPSIAAGRPSSPNRNVRFSPATMPPQPLPAPRTPSAASILTPKRSCGYLSKMHSTWHLWQSRYFVLDEGFLHHFKPRRLLARTLLQHPVYKTPSGEGYSMERAADIVGGGGGGSQLLRTDSPSHDRPLPSASAEVRGRERGLTLHTPPSMESLLPVVEETAPASLPSTQTTGERTASPTQSPSPPRRGNHILHLPGKKRRQSGLAHIPHYASIRDPACHLNEAYVDSAFKLRCSYNVLNFKLVSVASNNSLMQLVQIMPHLGAAPESKDRVVLYLKAKSAADKEAWIADFTAHALYMMHVKMRQLIKPVSEIP